jgi:ubiquinone/menaquinone biosynthesis C-methylase UbiE
MGFYDRWVLPRVLDLMMGTRVFQEQRALALAGVSGRVLEVGFGSGHNLPFYPPGVTAVVGVDPSGESARLARKRIARAPFPVELLPLPGEQIPVPDGSFDAVVSSFTLCTIPDPQVALRQLRRVLKPHGRFFFVEHGRAPEPKVQRWQDRLNGLQKRLLGGCHLNRDMQALVAAAGFGFDKLERYYVPGPRVGCYLYRGVARPVA